MASTAAVAAAAAPVAQPLTQTVHVAAANPGDISFPWDDG